MNAVKYPSLLPQKKKKKQLKIKFTNFPGLFIRSSINFQFSYLPRLEVLAKFTKEDIA